MSQFSSEELRARHGGQYSNSQLVKLQKTSVFGVLNHNWEVNITDPSHHGSGNMAEEEAERLYKPRLRRTAVKVSSGHGRLLHLQFHSLDSTFTRSRPSTFWYEWVKSTRVSAIRISYYKFMGTGEGSIVFELCFSGRLIML